MEVLEVEDSNLLSNSAEPTRRKRQRSKPFNCKSFAIGLTVGCAVGLILFLGLHFGLQAASTNGSSFKENPSKPVKNSGIYKSAAVASDAAQCSTIGKDILKAGGSAADSAIATALCTCLHNMHSCGLGGGFFMIYYEAETGKATFINARETAPNASSEDMYHHNGKLSQLGALSVAVPGEIAGYWEVHQRFGKLQWKDLFSPAIDMAENGFVIGHALGRAIGLYEHYVKNRTFNLWPIFENDDGSLKTQGDVVRLPLLATTLRKLAAGGMNEFYQGSLASDIISDLKDGFGNSIMTPEDLSSYSPQIKQAINISLDSTTIFSPGIPGSGSVLNLMLNILDGYNFTPDSLSENNKVLTYHRIVEAFRFAFAKRSALGDDANNEALNELVNNMSSNSYADFLRLKIDDQRTHPVKYYDPAFDLSNDAGTSHLSIYAPNGDAVSLTTTINLYFGSKVRGHRTGIFFNNEMDDFSSPGVKNYFGLPPSPSNFIRPGRRPMSSMSPAIAVETDKKTGKQKVRMISGAAGGTQITTATALTLMDCLWFGDNVSTSVEKKRLHDQLMPNTVFFEPGFDPGVIEGLVEKGHVKKMMKSFGSIVQAILLTDDGKVSAACDSRKGGAPDGY